MDWIWRLCNITFESGFVPEDWRRSAVIILLCKKGERTKCKNCRGISLLSVVQKTYFGILVDRVHRATGDLIDDEQEIFRAGKVCVDQMFTLKQIKEKAQEKKCRVYVSFIDLEKVYDRVNREGLWQVLRMYDMGANI